MAKKLVDVEQNDILWALIRLIYHEGRESKAIPKVFFYLLAAKMKSFYHIIMEPEELGALIDKYYEKGLLVKIENDCRSVIGYALNLNEFPSIVALNNHSRTIWPSPDDENGWKEFFSEEKSPIQFPNNA